MKIQESAENYLETILVLKERKGLVRSIDIANELVDPAIASEDACRIEHVISAESFAAIKAHVQKHDAE